MSDESELPIEYRFKHPDGRLQTFRVVLDLNTLLQIRVDTEPPPDWTKLECEQCPHCPLTPEQSPQCPVATSLLPILTNFDTYVSHDQVSIEVVTPDRRINYEATMQQVLGSLMGLLIPTSGCPHSAFLRPMARFHLPAANSEETLYRSVSMYTLAQLMRRSAGLTADDGLSGLLTHYENLEDLNAATARRLTIASKTDAGLNGLVLLDLHTKLAPLYMEDNRLDELRPLFASYLQD